MKETDLYPPVKAFLEARGWSVRGEVGACDVLAVRDHQMLAVELKLGISLRLLLQAVDRMEAVDLVYLAVPFQSRHRRREQARLLKLLRMLGLGLLLVDTDRGIVQPGLDPGEYRPRLRKARRGLLLKEHEALVGDPNTGGSSRRRGVMTRYRLRAMTLAAFLRENGPSRATVVSRETGEPGALSILYRNVYGWFERRERGVYSLSERGVRELPLWE